MKTKTKLVILSIAVLVTTSSWAQVPQLIHFQGRMLSGSNLVNGNVGLSLRLFNLPAGGSKIYEDSNSVTVVDGLYSTYIGDNPTNSSFLVALTNAAVWIEVAVNGTALTPRERLASVGYSLATRGISVDTNNSAIFNPSQNAVDGSAAFSTIGGGSGNSIQSGSVVSFLGGGGFNTIQSNANVSFLGGGFGNTIRANADHSVVVGGSYNTIHSNANLAVLGGGISNSIQFDAQISVLVGGSGNSIQTNSPYSVLGGGLQNSIQADSIGSVLVGGYANNIQTSGSFLGGGDHNNILGFSPSSFLGGGMNNTIQGAETAVIVGGRDNSIGTEAYESIIGGGEANAIRSNANHSVIAGGQANTIQTNSNHAVIVGGWGNTIWADSNNSYLGGGEGNSIGPNAQAAMILGGTLNSAGNGAQNSFAGGYRAKANHASTFVWADGTDADFASTGGGQFLIRADGGVGIGVNSPQATLHVAGTGAFNGFLRVGTATPSGYTLQVNGTAHRVDNSPNWDTTSDRRLKTGIEPLSDALALLERIKPVNFFYSEEYLAANSGLPAAKQFGVIAQEYQQVFPNFVSTNSDGYLTVNTSPMLFVNTAAIQELESEVARLQIQNAEQQKLLLDLRTRLEVLENR